MCLCPQPPINHKPIGTQTGRQGLSERPTRRGQSSLWWPERQLVPPPFPHRASINSSKNRWRGGLVGRTLPIGPDRTARSLPSGAGRPFAPAGPPAARPLPGADADSAHIHPIAYRNGVKSCGLPASGHRCVFVASWSSWSFCREQLPVTGHWKGMIPLEN